MSKLFSKCSPAQCTGCRFGHHSALATSDHLESNWLLTARPVCSEYCSSAHTFLAASTPLVAADPHASTNFLQVGSTAGMGKRQTQAGSNLAIDSWARHYCSSC
jgi:hypothetical protein